MKLLFIVLNAPERLEEILEGLVEAGVKGATVLDSVGMGHILDTVPLFAGMRPLFRSARPRNNTIFSVTGEEEAEKAMRMLEKSLGAGPGREQGDGCAFVVSVEKSVGIA
jgi:nitrogen regulatory protein PII